MDRDTKFKLHQINFDSGKTIVLEEHVKREVLNLRQINETLKENVKNNTDKLVSLQLEVASLMRGDRPRDQANSFLGGEQKLE